ncbi:hypothetical protein LCGC14_0289420 [marine sediment metagenome]|uniref:Uncharacterized protein n=1 Tax=marine sediment metagenome TaxID=412755 RepID=A0A0F9TTV5_9ZZZZ
MHLHSALQEEAQCRGISGAKWMTEAAREKLNAVYAFEGKKVPHDGPAPDWDCTCGHYFYRTLKDAYLTPYNIYAHVTCLKRTMLHTGGGRTTQYSIDYFLSPERPGQKVYIAPAMPPAMQQPVYPSALAWPPPILGSSHDQQEVLGAIGMSLGIPILDRDDMRGCPSCLEINGWRKKTEITDRMRKDFFGEGYRK